MALALSTITAAIAALSVSGVTIKDTSAIPKSVEPRDCPILYPRPDGFVSAFNVVRDSFGADSQARKTVTYTLTYRFLYAALGTDRAAVFDAYDDFAAKAFAILDVILANSTISGLVDLTPIDTPAWGPVSDPSGKMFHGTDISLAVTEFVN